MDLTDSLEHNLFYWNRQHILMEQEKEKRQCSSHRLCLRDVSSCELG